MDTPPPAPSSRSRIVFLGVLLLAAGVFIGRYVIPAGDLPANSPLRFVTVEEGKRQLIFPTFWEAWDELHEKFIGELTEEQLFYGAVAGMVQAAGDPYTVFADPQESKRFKETIEGSFSGIGVEIGMRNGIVTVIAPLDESPADQAGILPGDSIVAIDHTPLKPEVSLDEVVSKIRGEEGTTVVLTVVHKDARETADITVTRERIEIESVKTATDGDITILTITSFNGDTAARFTAAARQAVQAKSAGIIVDLRNNPGGFLQSAVEIASRFLPKGKLVVAEKGSVSKEYFAEGNATLADKPVVLLVNNGSASASEILAGALHDHLDAPIIGTKTFGKGSVQELLELEDGSSLRVTVAKWFTPNGRNIDEAGIEPTIVIEQDTATDADEELQRAKEELRRLIESRT